ncbi:uncharacterized protein SCHCODRAFT_02058798 [Schizophyllum commune H4-8]|uniref:uncharacterized protein n=1 Tax=Schizophyllum commune (strain H4-8 / FGSC 9210) TaxID=578458 RepID=UPI0021600C33|nr:uncharacterized protein SCHCODRAFT_02058798 [Schizophyllum commune H4-8]KAI5888620.1 hypothetical protein SCHCODRAFT_02058798 [Schizophyllum commune H4-8]
MFMYGSILIAVTFKPSVLSSNPVDEATIHWSPSSRDAKHSARTDDTLPDAAHDTSRDENVLGHCWRRRRRAAARVGECESRGASCKFLFKARRDHCR